MNMAFGVKGGISLNHMWGDDWDDQITLYDGDNKMRLGFSVGGFLAVNVMKNFALQPEIYISLIGGGMDYTYAGNEIENYQRLWILEIPILAKFIMPAGKFKGGIFAGPDIMIKMFDYTIREESSAGDADAVTDDSFFKRPYLGLVAGVELGIPITQKMSFLIDVRYCLMVSDIYDDEVVVNPEWKSNSLKFMVGIGTGL
jgi:hypothetical protein